MTQKEYDLESAKIARREAQAKFDQAEAALSTGFKVETAKVEQARQEAQREVSDLKQKVEAAHCALDRAKAWAECCKTNLPFDA